MAEDDRAALALLSEKLAAANALSRGAKDALDRLSPTIRHYSSGTYLLREGQRPRVCALLVDGFVFRQKLTIEGARSISGLLIPGDLTDTVLLLLDEADHDVVTMTAVTLAEFDVYELRAIALEHCDVAVALWRIALVEGSIAREWLCNVARRSARVAAAHLLCEIAARLDLSIVNDQPRYDLPMTQEQMGDALGLTAVHVNRVLKGLEKDGLIARHKRDVVVVNLARLRQAADFNPRYLHRAQMTP